jgi:hypothetical protein
LFGVLRGLHPVFVHVPQPFVSNPVSDERIVTRTRWLGSASPLAMIEFSPASKFRSRA